jgi:hypothetical protein
MREQILYTLNAYKIEPVYSNFIKGKHKPTRTNLSNKYPFSIILNLQDSIKPKSK